jgi:hypothetical protein
MASKHQLSLEVPDTNNCSVFRIFDTSIYTPDLEVTCPRLEITSPGFNEPVVIEIAVDPSVTPFNYILNGCTLGLQSQDCGTHNDRLPDGIYSIRYSVSPNDKVYVEYQYLRVCQTVNKYFNQLCRLELAACEPEGQVKAILNELRMIKSFIDAAKAKVEECGRPNEGMELLVYAQRRLHQLEAEC